MSALNFNTWTSLDGSGNYPAKAYVNFNGVGTIAIRAAANVTSLVDNGVGDYSVNFTIPMAVINYTSLVTTNGGTTIGSTTTNVAASARPVTTSQVRIFTYQSSASATLTDMDHVNLATFI